MALTSVSGFAKGMFWCYEIVGVAYDKANGLPLVNQVIVVDDDTVTTDSLGRFRAKVCGGTCDRGSSWTIWRCNAKHNGHVEIRLLGSPYSKRMKSKWRKYGINCITKDKRDADCNVWHKNLYFPTRKRGATHPS